MKMAKSKIREEIQYARESHPNELGMIYYIFGIVEMAAELADGKDETPFTDVIKEISKAYGYDMEESK